jgi:hypothetical protein
VLASQICCRRSESVMGWVGTLPPVADTWGAGSTCLSSADGLLTRPGDNHATNISLPCTFNNLISVLQKHQPH